jgi:outer membrane protein assembly factor BamB
MSLRPAGWLLVLASFLLCAGLVTTCAHRSVSECRSDFDCKLERVCDRGACVWPSRTGSPAPTPPPAIDEEGNTVETTPTQPPAPVLSDAQAMFRQDPMHRGRSRFRMPIKRPEIRWTYESRGSISSSPAVSKDGWVVVGSQDGKVHLIAADGKSLWAFPTTDMVFGSPAIGSSGIVYAGSDDDHLYALDPKERKELWRFRLGACRAGPPGPDNSRCDADGGPTIGPDGTLYLGGDGVYAVNPDGSLKWRFATGGHVGTAPSLLPDGTVVVGSQDNLIYGIKPDGTKRWDFRAGDDVESTPAIGDDGTIYIGSDDQKLYALAPDGGLRWAFNAGGDIRASPALGLDGTIYVGSFDGLMYAVRPDGTLQWTFRAGDRILSSALVDAGSAILFGSQDDRLYALEANGHLRWSVELFGDIDSSPSLGSDGTIFVGADDRKLYALR